jgi:hypothetical protein
VFSDPLGDSVLQRGQMPPELDLSDLDFSAVQV